MSPTLATNETPQSAIEYCLNKNKRTATGEIDFDHLTWFMPSIDQIEEITKGGYSDFEVFQNKLYWSSQPAYKKYDFAFSGTYQIIFTCTYGEEGIFFNDHPSRARATKVDGGNNYANIKSGSSGTWGTLSYTQSQLNTPSKTDPVDNENNISYDEGCLPRTETHRVRSCYSAN